MCWLLLRYFPPHPDLQGGRIQTWESTGSVPLGVWDASKEGEERLEVMELIAGNRYAAFFKKGAKKVHLIPLLSAAAKTTEIKTPKPVTGLVTISSRLLFTLSDQSRKYGFIIKIERNVTVLSLCFSEAETRREGGGERVG